jgi:hypothetical protein
MEGGTRRQRRGCSATFTRGATARVAAWPIACPTVDFKGWYAGRGGQDMGGVPPEEKLLTRPGRYLSDRATPLRGLCYQTQTVTQESPLRLVPKQRASGISSWVASVAAPVRRNVDVDRQTCHLACLPGVEGHACPRVSRPSRLYTHGVCVRDTQIAGTDKQTSKASIHANNIAKQALHCARGVLPTLTRAQSARAVSAHINVRADGAAAQALLSRCVATVGLVDLRQGVLVGAIAFGRGLWPSCHGVWRLQAARLCACGQTPCAPGRPGRWMGRRWLEPLCVMNHAQSLSRWRPGGVLSDFAFDLDIIGTSLDTDRTDSRQSV